MIVKIVPQLARFVAQITAVSPTIAPTEISIPPVTMTKVSPNATRAIIVDWTPISSKISKLRKMGSRRPKITKVIASAITTPKIRVLSPFGVLFNKFTFKQCWIKTNGV